MFTVNPLSQSDPRWKGKILGNDNTTTIGKYGCLLTCMTMVANGFGFQETPDSLNDKFLASGGFQGAMVIPGAFPAALPGVSFKNYQTRENNPMLMDEINYTLSMGNPVIGMVDYSPSPGVQNHWIVILGRKGTDYVIQDPYPFPVESTEVLLSKRYGFAGSPQKIIQAGLWLEGHGIAPQPSKKSTKPKPASSFDVYAIEDALALRTQPVVADDTLIKRVPLLNQFYVIEDVATAKAKIGQQNQWIKVMDAYGGEEGFVAAWFVSMEKKIPSTETQPSAPPQPAQPTPVIPLPEEDPDQVLIVFAAADGLAIRSEPVVLDTNLLKRVPVNSQFLVLEPAIQALAKLGVFNQWLNVKDATGMKGYVAAWFVTQKHQDPLGVVDQVVFSLPTQPLAKKSPVARKKSNLGSKKSNAVSKKPASAGKKSASASKISTTASKKSTSASTRSTLVIKKPTTASKKSSSASKKSTSVGKKSTSVSKKSPPSLKNN